MKSLTCLIISIKVSALESVALHPGIHFGVHQLNSGHCFEKAEHVVVQKLTERQLCEVLLFALRIDLKLQCKYDDLISLETKLHDLKLYFKYNCRHYGKCNQFDQFSFLRHLDLCIPNYDLLNISMV